MRSVAGQVLLLQTVIAVLLIGVAVTAATLQARQHGEDHALDRSLDVAHAFANRPVVLAGLESADPTAMLQPRVEDVQRGFGAPAWDVDFLSVLGPNGTRYADTHPRLIGSRAQGIAQAVNGKAFADIVDLPHRGEAARAVVPVMDDRGTVVGLVSAGVRVEGVSAVVAGQLPLIFGAGGGALALAVGGSVLVSRRLWRQTRGSGPAEITRMYEHHDAVLHAVREGVLIIGGDGRLMLANDEARRLLELPDAEGRHVAELGLDTEIAELLASGRTVSDEVHLAGDRLLAVNTRPTAPYGGRPGIAVTLRDTTELRAVSGVAEVARERLRMLYDAGVRIGTTLDVVRTAEELAEVAVPRFADIVTVELLDPVLRGEEPTGAPAEMQRAALAGAGGKHRLQPVGDSIRFDVPTTAMARALATGRGVLATDLATTGGWRAQRTDESADALDDGIYSLISVPLQARDVVLGMANFWRSERPEPFDEDDLAFAEELAARAAVAVDNARHYTREHTLSIALQRSLLPGVLPGQDALEVAYRYLPAQAGVGGDWFDVIPLPGARVALVVGDVVGHGVHAAATMGRLRTAVHNFSALDLPPDEILRRLDELVVRIDQDETEEAEGDGITGATCLYAIYDPVSGRCTLARAGHFAPMLLRPDGTVDLAESPISPPLGLGGAPFQSLALVLDEGSQLVLYTDGLIENRDRDVDTGLRLLRDTLADHASRAPEETCRAVFGAMLPPHRRDDIALLVAGTRLVDPSLVADWDVPADPAAVARLRSECVRRVEEWDLEELGFATELLVGELVTNAIRYGSEPIHVRLLRGRSLICEVSDGSSTAPHLRRAATTDEGGRGLFLVAQIARRWGTRYTPTGKVIWTEQALTDGEMTATGTVPDDVVW